MRISRIDIRNFRSIKELSVNFPEKGLFVLVGPNNAGKSNFIRALNVILGDGWVSGERLEDYDFYRRDRDNRIIINIEFDNGRRAIFNSAEKWTKYYDEIEREIYRSRGDIKKDFPCTHIPAGRSLDTHLQFRRWALMGKISHAFHIAAKPKKDELETKFDEIMDIFDSIDEFSQFKTDFIEYFEEMQADTPYKLQIDFKAFTPNDYFRTIHILAEDPNLKENFDLEELGDGTRNIVLLSLLRSYAKNFRNDAQGILAIEEPEIFMHPQARRHLYQIFKEITSNSDIQIILTTHSSSFIDTEYFDTIGEVYKEPDEYGVPNTKIKLVTRQKLVNFAKQTGVPQNKTTINSITEYYRTTSNYMLNEAFFSKSLILVEGETEELAIPVYLRHLEIDCDLLGISIIAVNGKNQIPKYWRMFYTFGIPMLVLIDNDSTPEKVKSNKNIAACFNCSIEDIADNTDIYKIIDTSKDGVFTQKVMMLEKDFEYALKKDWIVCGYDINIIEGYEKEAKNLIKPIKNQQKGQIARFIANKLTSEHSYAPSFIHEIKSIISDLK